MGKLDGKVAIVTGASRGIGKAIAIAFAKEGARVVVAARTEEEGGRIPGTIHQTVEETRGAGGEAIAIRADVTDEQSVEAMVRRTIEEFGNINVLVNNAGISVQSKIVDTPLRRWELSLRVNVTGPFLCAKAVLPKMMEQRSGSIINITSPAASPPTGSFRGLGGVLYGMSKAALNRFTFGLAEEVREYNIAVNALAPGLIKTEGAVYFMGENYDWSAYSPPEVVGPSAIFLAAQDATSFTGKLVHAPEFGQSWP